MPQRGSQDLDIGTYQSRHEMMKAVQWEGHVGEMVVRHIPKPRITKDAQLLIRITTAASKIALLFIADSTLTI